MKRIFALHFRYSRIRRILGEAINFICDSLLIRLRYFWKCFSRRSFELNSVLQISSSSRSFSQDMFSPGSFRAFNASSISIRSSITCSSFKSSIETIAASASPRLVKTNDSFPYATLFIIFANFFLASAAEILFSMAYHLLYKSLYLYILVLKYNKHIIVSMAEKV